MCNWVYAKQAVASHAEEWVSGRGPAQFQTGQSEDGHCSFPPAQMARLVAAEGGRLPDQIKSSLILPHALQHALPQSGLVW